MKEIAAKVEISKDDYNKFLKSVSGKYKQFTLDDCSIDDFSYYLPDVIDCESSIGLEEYIIDWWDMDVESIEKIYYPEQFNPFSRHPGVKKVYVTQSDDSIILYMYCDFLL